MSSTNEFINQINCPVCQSKQRVATALNICATCGWEFMLFGSMLPASLTSEMAQKIEVQKKIRAQFEFNQQSIERAEKKIASLEQQSVLQSNLLQGIQRKNQDLEASIANLQQKLVNAIDLTNEIRKMHEVLADLDAESGETIFKTAIYDLECSYTEGVIRVECPKPVSLQQLPRLVLGVHLKMNMAVVSQAAIIYLLPVWSAFKQQSTLQSWILEYPYPMALPKTAYLKFGSDQSNSIFNIITKEQR
jgi:ribosomal protein L37AE/L43A